MVEDKYLVGMTLTGQKNSKRSRAKRKYHEGHNNLLISLKFPLFLKRSRGLKANRLHTISHCGNEIFYVVVALNITKKWMFWFFLKFTDNFLDIVYKFLSRPFAIYGKN